MLTRWIDVKSEIAIMSVLIGIAAMMPAQWRASAKRAGSYAVYYVGYRVLSLQLSCGSLAVSGMPLVLKQI
jgi:hypothetical protein